LTLLGESQPYRLVHQSRLKDLSNSKNQSTRDNHQLPNIEFQPL
jgi:hypothetical protein